MHICEKCGRELSDNIKVCPFCSTDSYINGDITAEILSDLPAETPVPSAEAESKSIDVPAPEAEENTPVSGNPDMASEENPAEETAEPEQEEQSSVEISDAAASECSTDPEVPSDENAAKPVSDIAVSSLPETSPEKSGTRENFFDKLRAKKAERDKIREEKQSSGEERLPKDSFGTVAVVTIVILAVAMAAMAITMIAVPLYQQTQDVAESAQQAFMDFLEGEWISGTFIYDGQQNPSCELLTIGSDFSYTSITMTSPDSSEEYDASTWTETDRIEGSVYIETDKASIRVSYDKADGSTYVYRRYILELSEDNLVLREYYNQEMTDYYDVAFTKVK